MLSLSMFSLAVFSLVKFSPMTVPSLTCVAAARRARDWSPARRCWTLLLAVVLGCAMWGPAVAQDVQVPLDRDGTLYVIGADLQSELGLFPFVSGFQEARLYRAEGQPAEGQYDLVIRYREDGKALRERRMLSHAEVEDLRMRISKGRASVEPASPGAPSEEPLGTDTGRLQEGRYGLVAATTFHGLAEGGLLAGAFNAEGSGATTLTLLGGTAGFFVPLLATRNATVTEAEADMAFYGGLQGYAHATQIAGLLSGEDPPGRGTAAFMAAGGALEGTLGYQVARRGNWSAGHAEMVVANGIGGNFIGLGIGGAVVGEELEADEAPRIVAGSSLLGSVAGAYLGHRMGRTGRYTEGDARIYAQSAFQGANLAGSLLLPGSDVGPRAAALLLSGSAVGGAVLGRSLTGGRDFTGTEGSLVALGSVAGSLLGIAVTAGGDDAEAAAAAQAVGSAAGFGITYAVLEGDKQGRVEGKASGGKASSLDVDLSAGPTLAPRVLDPAGAQHSGSGHLGSGEMEQKIVPRVTLEVSF